MNRKMSIQSKVTGWISQQVVILTVAEYNAAISEAFAAGVERGRFEERCPPTSNEDDDP